MKAACVSGMCEHVLQSLVNLTSDTNKFVSAQARESLDMCTQPSRLRAEYATIKIFSKQASQPMAYRDDHMLEVPPGIAMAVVGLRASRLAAHRCPNQEACPGNGDSLGVDFSGSQPTCGIGTIPPGPCAPGYNPD
eukprot:176621-Pyramimonas_sp.AAC.1